MSSESEKRSKLNQMLAFDTLAHTKRQESVSNSTQKPSSNAALVTTKEEDQFGILGEVTDQALTKLPENTRIIAQDGNQNMVTMDFVPGRINLHIEDGLVVAYEVEGMV